MAKGGATTWYFPDGYLPAKSSPGELESHEALMLLNTHSTKANIKLDFYFEDREPVQNISVVVGAERIKCLRLDHPADIGGVVIPPLTQYSIRVRSDCPIIAQFGRLDATQVNLAYYGILGYSE